MPSLRLTLGRRAAGEFSPLLQGGVILPVSEGMSVQALLEDALGLTPEFVAERVCTVFLDGEPVDDLRTAVLTEGTTLALSAAMPGLAGGTLRRGSPLAAMRSTVSHRPSRGAGGGRPVAVLVKLFNLLMRDLGPDILERGVLVPPARLAAFLSSLPAAFWRDCRNVMMNGEPVTSGPNVVEGLKKKGEPVEFAVIFEE